MMALRRSIRSGGAGNAFFVVESRGRYPEAPGARIAKTYGQLSQGPKTGRVLFDELETEDWQLPRARRRYRWSEFQQHLRHLVQRERLHVVPLGQLSPDAARGLRSDLKAALTRFASGRASIEPLLHEVERVAKYVSGDHKKPLGKARKAMTTLVKQFAVWAVGETGLPGMSWGRLYQEVLEARNDIAHTGTEAVLAGTRTAALATVLMEALVRVAEEGAVNRVRDVMVGDPVCAHRWQTVADVRRTMLVHDYSELPLSGAGSDRWWKTVTARNLAAYLATDRTAKLGLTLDEALEESDPPLQLCEARTVAETAPVREVWDEAGDESGLVLIVTRKGSNGPIVVGIVTPFDLL